MTDWYMPDSLTVELKNDYAQYPLKAHNGDLGYDLFSCENTSIAPGETKLISTGVKIAFPAKYGAKLFDRSSVASKNKIFVVAGVIDSGYRGEIKVAMYNSNTAVTYPIKVGDRIAQMVLMEVVSLPIIPGMVDVNETSRGAGGFGSTGK